MAAAGGVTGGGAGAALRDPGDPRSAVPPDGARAPGPPGSHVGWMRSYSRLLAAADGACAAAGGLLALAVRFSDMLATAAASPYLLITAGLPLAWVVCVGVAGGYEQRFIGVGTEEFRRVAASGVVLTAAVAVLSYLLALDLARGYIMVVLPAVTVLSLVVRFAVRKHLHRCRRRGRFMRRVVVVGHRDAAEEVVRHLRREPHHGMEVVGVCLPRRPERAPVNAVAGTPVLGDFAEVDRGVLCARADTVAVLGCPEMAGARLRRLAWRLEEIGADLTVAPVLMDVAGPRTSIRPVAGLPLLHVDHPRLDGWTSLVKEVFDRCAAAIALLALAPVFLVLAVLVRQDGGGSAFFTQTRVGRGGTEFTVYKFRTMVADAERRRAELQAVNEHDGVLFKLRSDPRVTPVGAWLRRYSLDELPQLFNVLLGHMSLVGPRPPLPEEVARYRGDVCRRLVVKPGMTGLWQVSGRSDLSWEESVRLDLRYVENWSLTLDVQILWKTWSAVVRGAGAY